MSVTTLITSMEKLLKLHKSLYELAQKKTDFVKKGDIDALDHLIKDEQTHLTAISRIEKDRLAAAKILLPDIEQPTVADCLEKVNESNKQKLESIRDELVEIVFHIQEKNELNQQLIYQSMQFVNFSLSLVTPQPENYTYGPPADKNKAAGQSAGMFNSKA
jgi:flagellar biosynthesis/type III secretory pathway chaperone